MRVWLITIGEPLPTDPNCPRLLRTGILAETLVKRGHEVVWWSSTFDHPKKQHRFNQNTTQEVLPGYRIELLHSVPYRRNVSIARMLNHRGIARVFRRRLRSASPPDIILCSYPTIELSVSAVRFGRRHGVPVILDVRDLWPDIFLDVVPSSIRWLARLPLYHLMREARYALSNADAIVAMSQGCLDWGLSYAMRSVGPNDRLFPLAYRRTDPAPDRMAEAAVALKAKGVDYSKLICWFVGTFGKVYDVGTLIAGAREMIQRGVEHVQFVLSGDGDRRAEWTAQAAGLRNVVFTGWISQPEIAYLMSVAKVGLVAYDAGPEFLPNKLFEYLSAGLPVLSSICGKEARRMITDYQCGLNYTAGDVTAFVAALTALIGDEALRKRMGENALKLFESEFDATKVYPRMAEYLVGVASEFRSRRSIARDLRPVNVVF